jgi:PleD family two-component response regulator
MEDSLQRFVRLADRENRDVSIVMVDLDHFKRLNDEHGHAFGDSVLRDTAMTIVGALRETDIVCRYGGEELVVILSDCSLERAADSALYRAKQAGRNRVVTAPTRPFQLDRLEDGLPAPALQAAE